MSDLYKLTRDLHHAAEVHPFGAKMARGDLSPVQYASWLGALRVIHEGVDPFLPEYVHRTEQINNDQIDMLPINGRPILAAREMAEWVNNLDRAEGAGYILCGAHLRGGAVIRRSLEPRGLPCRHLRFEDARSANEYITFLRSKAHLEAEARRTFKYLIEVMEQIEKG